ncbi:MAG: hypothetical protein ACRDD1_21735, partial [Planctomycetia bacterium]
LVVDAGSLTPAMPNYVDNPVRRLGRALAVGHQQANEHRKRWLVQGYLTGALKGAYLGLSTYHGNYGLPGSIGYPRDVVAQLRQTPVHFDGLTIEQIMALANHGYTIADAGLRRMAGPAFAPPTPFELPYPEFVEHGQVLRAIEPPAAWKARRHHEEASSAA